MTEQNDTRLAALAAGIREELAAIGADRRSELEHALAAGEKLREAKAALGHGEWLPWLAENFGLSQVTASGYMRLAANHKRASNFSSIREALAALKASSPSRSRQPGRYSAARDPAVVAWVNARRAEGLGRDEIAAASKTAEGWPGRAGGIGAGTVSSVPQEAPREAQPKPPRREGARRERQAGKSRREAEAERQRNSADLFRAQERLMRVVRVLETTDFAAEYELDDVTEEALMEFADGLATTAEWCERALPLVKARLGSLKTMELIRKLENTKGRGPEEAASYRRRAAILRRKHGLELVA